MNAIETDRLSRRFGRTEAVHDLTLGIPTGSVFALLGPNGAGKTTTLKMLMNLLPPSSGQARVLGVNSRKLGEREFAQIGYVSENQEMPDWMTVRQLLDYCRPFYPTWDRTLEATLMRQFALPPARKLAQLSRGMRMKAALLSSLAYRPKLLVLDEPFSGLDPLVRDEFIRGVLEVSSHGEWTVLLSSHDIDEVERLADHIAMIDAGHLRLSESADSLQARFRRVEITGTVAPAAAAGARDWLEWETAGGLTRFVETQYAREKTEGNWRQRFGPDVTIVAHPMSLREIFLVLARRAQSRPVEASA